MIDEIAQDQDKKGPESSEQQDKVKEIKEQGREKMRDAVSKMQTELQLIYAEKDVDKGMGYTASFGNVLSAINDLYRASGEALYELREAGVSPGTDKYEEYMNYVSKTEYHAAEVVEAMAMFFRRDGARLATKFPMTTPRSESFYKPREDKERAKK